MAGEAKELEEVLEQPKGKWTQAAVHDDDDKFAVFERWLLDSGARFPQLELRDYGEEVRGVHAVEDVEEDSVVVEVPLNCLITVEMGKDTTIGRKIIAANVDLDAPKHIFLMMFLLIDRKNPDSFYRPYYDILPRTLRNMPIFWDEAELEWLRGSYLLSQIDERKLAIDNDYRAICAVAPELASYATPEEFAWARMCVCSRNFGLTVNDLRTAALVPYADMLNHYRPRETKWEFDDTRQAFTITTLQPIGGGAQVYDSYGQKCNHRFLLNYGFSVENNVEADSHCPNECPLLLELSRSDPLYDRKLLMYGGDGSLPRRRVRVCVSDNENTKLLFALLRVIAADESDMRVLAGGASSSVHRSIRDAQYPVSLKNERAALALLSTLCDEYLSRYPNTYEHDVALLASSELPPFSNRRHAVIQVRGEKEVLRHFRAHAQAALRAIDAPTEQAYEAVVEELYANAHHLISKYVMNVVSHLRSEERRQRDMVERSDAFPAGDLRRPTVV